LLLLERFGFTHLEGVDKFIEKTITYPSGLTIHRSEMSELNRSYDIVMSHHVFEHLPDPLEAIKDMARLTKPGGYVFIRMPNADSFAKEHYGINWINWDPPRHVFVHTPASVEILAKKANLEVKDIFFDSENFQFTGSEQYVKNIPLMEEDLHDVHPKEARDAYTCIANALNLLKRRDSIGVVLRKPE
jgi:predicted SAM-dependent methyltransferase